jgi:hypothetical protein
MARRLGRDVKTIRRALGRPPRPPEPSKLAAYQTLITARFEQGLRSPRILRELRARGYTGGATILKDFLQTLGPRRRPRHGLRQRMTTLTPIHLRALESLAELYGDAAMRQALQVAITYRNFNAHAVERILQRAHPSVVPEPPVAPRTPRPEAL